MTPPGERAPAQEETQNEIHDGYFKELNGSALESVTTLKEWINRFNTAYCKTEHPPHFPPEDELGEFLDSIADPNRFPEIILYLTNGQRANIARSFSGDKLLHVDVMANDGGNTPPIRVI